MLGGKADGGCQGKSDRLRTEKKWTKERRQKRRKSRRSHGEERKRRAHIERELLKRGLEEKRQRSEIHIRHRSC